jgi:hypothetical protein
MDNTGHLVCSVQIPEKHLLIIRLPKSLTGLVFHDVIELGVAEVINCRHLRYLANKHAAFLPNSRRVVVGLYGDFNVHKFGSFLYSTQNDSEALDAQLVVGAAPSLLIHNYTDTRSRILARSE